jgi:hypothetical protein
MFYCASLHCSALQKALEQLIGIPSTYASTGRPALGKAQARFVWLVEVTKKLMGFI